MEGESHTSKFMLVFVGNQCKLFTLDDRSLSFQESNDWFVFKKKLLPLLYFVSIVDLIYPSWNSSHYCNKLGYIGKHNHEIFWVWNSTQVLAHAHLKFLFSAVNMFIIKNYFINFIILLLFISGRSCYKTSH